MLIIYKKSNGEVVNNQGTNETFPLGVTNVQPILDNVIANNGGSYDDYGIIRLHDIEDKAIVEKTFTNLYSVEKGQLVFGGLIPVQEPEPQLPTETELLTDYIIDVDYRVTMIELGL